MKQGEGSMPSSQRHIIRVLCCITTVSCSVCLLLTTTILVVVLCHKAGPMTEKNKDISEPLKNSFITSQDKDGKGAFDDDDSAVIACITAFSELHNIDLVLDIEDEPKISIALMEIIATEVEISLRKRKDFHQHLMELLQARKTTVAHLQLAAWQNNPEKLMWNSDGILENIDYQAGLFMIKTSGFYFVYCHLHFKRNCSGESPDLTIGLRVNGEVKHETLHTCNLESSSEKGYTSQFLGVVFSLRTNDTVSVFTTWADFVDRDTMIRSNVFGIFTLH